MKFALLPLASFVLMTMLLVGGWWFIQERERDVLQTRLDVTSQQVAGRLEDFLSTHVGQMAALGERVGALEVFNEEVFLRISHDHQVHHRGFQALNWINTSGIILWVHPEELNPGVLGFDLHNHPAAAETFLETERTGDVGVSPPLALLQGGWGFATYTRVARQGRTIGYLNGVFRIPALLERCLAEREYRELNYVLHGGEDVLGVLGLSPEIVPGLPTAEYPVRISGQEMTLSVIAPPRLVAADATWADEALLLCGVLLAGLLASMVHVARRGQLETEIAAERLEVIVDNAPDAIVVLDPQSGRFVHGNQQAGDLLDLGPEVLARTGPVRVSPELQADGQKSAAAFSEYLRLAAAGTAQEFEWTFLGRARVEIPAEVHLVRLPGQRRDLVRCNIRDLRRRREMEESLRRSRALEAMGQLAGGVAHDFNNILTAILGSCELLAQKVRGDTEAEELVEDTISASVRAGELTHQLLAFSRNAALRLEVLDLNAIVEGLLPMFAHLLGEKIEMKTELDARPVFVLADASRIEMVILNLTVNARDAMPWGGAITISTRSELAEAMLGVRDEGEGILPENLDRIFQPFFTTKEPGVGTGIGLATVAQIVDQLKGRTAVESLPGEGATFRVFLPRAEEARPAGSEVPEHATMARELEGDDAVVLVVEDHADVRAMSQRALTQAGYQVLQAADAEAALKLAEQYAGSIDVLVTDVVLPRMNGRELAVNLRRAEPGIAILFMTGYSDVEFDVGDLLTGKIELLSKPFGPSDLAHKVEEILSTRPGTQIDSPVDSASPHV